MTPRHFTRWQKAAAFVPALLLLVYLPAQAMFRCRMDGLLRLESCCSHQAQQEHEQPSAPTITAQDCCDQEIAQSDRPKAEVARSSSRDLTPTVAFAVFLSSATPLLAPTPPPPNARFDGAVQRYGPASAPPLVLLKHAFLI